MAAKDSFLDRFVHLYLLDRGVLLTPFHTMALLSPYTRVGDVDLHARILNECLTELFG